MYVGIRDLRRARGRFFLVATVIALITLLTVVLSGLTAGLAADSAGAVGALPGTTVVFGTSASQEPSFDRSTITVTDLQEMAVHADHAEGLGISRSNLEVGTATVPIALFGIPPVGLQAAALNDPDLGPETILLSAQAAAQANVAAGDQISLHGAAPRTVLIGPDLSHSHQPVAWVDLESWQTLTDNPDVVTVAVAAGLSPDDVAAIGDQFVALPTAKAPTAVAAFSQESLSLNLINGFLVAISALVVGAFFTVWTIQRNRDIAILKALGASNRYLLVDSLGQAVLILTMASTLGAVLGLTAGALLGKVAPFTQSLATVAIPVAATTLLGLAGAAIAIRSVTSVDPQAALGSAR